MRNFSNFLRNHFDPNLTLMLKKEVITHHTKWTEELHLPSITCYSMNFCDTVLTSKAHGIQEVSGSIPLISTKNTAFHFEMRCFSNFLTIFVILGQQKSQQDQPFLSSDRRKDGSDGLHSGIPSIFWSF